MNRSEIAAYALLVPLAYASYLAFGALAPLGVYDLLGLAAALGPAFALLRRDLSALPWLPGLFLFVVVFTVDGFSSNVLPGPLGGLAGGWVAGAPLFVGLSALAARRSAGSRALLSVVALLTATAVAALAQAGRYADPSAFANAFAALPRTEATALTTILTGGVPVYLPFDVPLPELFFPLALLGGAGALSGLLAVEGDRPIDAFGFDVIEPEVPEGTFRSLLPEGRERLKETTPEELPGAADLAALASLLVAVTAGLETLLLAIYSPNAVLPSITGLTVGLLVVIVFVSYRSRGDAPPRRPAASPSPAPARRGAAAPVTAGPPTQG